MRVSSAFEASSDVAGGSWGSGSSILTERGRGEGTVIGAAVGLEGFATDCDPKSGASLTDESERIEVSGSGTGLPNFPFGITTGSGGLDVVETVDSGFPEALTDGSSSILVCGLGICGNFSSPFMGTVFDASRKGRSSSCFPDRHGGVLVDLEPSVFVIAHPGIKSSWFSGPTGEVTEL